LENVEWGRLVDVLDSNGVIVETDVLIRESLQDQLGFYSLGLNPLTQSEILTIERSSSDSEFQQLLDAAQVGRSSVATKGLDGAPPFSLVARNGAMRLQFSEILAPDSVNRDTIQIAFGDPPTGAQQVRYIVDNDVIGADGKPKGVVIVDPTVSRFDSANLGISQNGTGFPESFDSESPNIDMRIPTVIDPVEGQFEVLRNLAGNQSISPTTSDPLEYTQLGNNPVIVRAFRSGNSSDPYNGFMIDNSRPEMVGEFETSITSIQEASFDPNLLTVEYSLDAVFCRDVTPKLGDVFELDGNLILVSRIEDASRPENYIISGSEIGGTSVPRGDFSADPLGASLTTSYGSADAQFQLCFVRFDPEPEFGLPARGIDPMSTLTLRFNEPIDVATVKALESFLCVSYLVSPVQPNGSSSQEEIDAWPARQFGYPNPETVASYIDRQSGYQLSGSGSGRIKFGTVIASPDGREYTLVPSFGITDSHDDGGNLRIAVAVRDGSDGILDLAGNQLNLNAFVAGNQGQDELVTPGPTNPWPRDRYFSLRFNSTDENGDGLAEFAGQFDFSNPGEMAGRDVARFPRQADLSNAYVAQRIAFSQGLMTPLTPAGAVLHTCWPYHLLGFGLFTVSELNVDIEGMNWAPFGGTVFDDLFFRYSLALSHCERTPDDLIDTQSGYPAYKNSGLQRNKDFDENVLGWTPTNTEHDEVVVADSQYNISAGNVFEATSGTKMMPWMDFDTTYTWRDTNISQYGTLDGAGFMGGKSGGFLNPEVTGLDKIWGPEEHRSIGVPLLARFRCYPKGEKFGTNGFQVQIMVGSSALPAFRVYSAGGRDSSGTWHQVIPDDPGADGTYPGGGFNTSTGVGTKAYGPELYWHQFDFVVRISRVYTHWFAFGGDPIQISGVTMEPRPEFQPLGTEIVVEFRGSADVNTTNCDPNDILNDANVLDLYGDKYEFPEGCGVVATPTGWNSDVSHLLNHSSGQKFDFFQIRMTFVSNIEMEIKPVLDGLGFAWSVD